MPDTRQYDAGPPGVGKTHLCVGLGIRAVEQGFSVQYFRFDELMTALKIDASLPPARLKRRKYMSSHPSRITPSRPHPGQRTPLGQRCWRTSAKHLASSSSPERLTKSDAGMITKAPCVRAAAD
jgi:IstB-like ATP binding protein